MTTSFDGEILRHVKDPFRYDRKAVLIDGKTSAAILAQFLPASVISVSAASRAENARL
jgi:hypothetical protein